MTKTATRQAPDPWNIAACDALIAELWTLRKSMLERQTKLEPLLASLKLAQQPSAINLAHYLAMRRFDLRRLQERLSEIGVSSLGRAETHALANVDKVLGILHRLANRPWEPHQHDEPTGSHSGSELLARHAEALFGPASAERRVRIMVTLPSEAAHDKTLVTALVTSGMDIARINCAHDDGAAWTGMCTLVRQAARDTGRSVRILMDLGGPKLRTGEIEGGVAVVKIKPERDALGHVVAPGRLALRPRGTPTPVPLPAWPVIAADPDWLSKLQVGDRVSVLDARAAKRLFTVIECSAAGALLETQKTVYLTSTSRPSLKGAAKSERHTTLTDLPAPRGLLHLHRGDRVQLVAEGLGHPARVKPKGKRMQMASIVCTLPQVLPALRKGQRIWFDDGRIGAVVVRQGMKRVEVEISQARDTGEKLAPDKGINLPDTVLDLPALTPKDIEDLSVAAQLADIIGLSFAQSADDVHALRQRLQDLGAPQVGLILKIETKRGFEHLPEMLLAAMAARCAGVMIARGDLAVECGYERMAEVQEEILWACEAAHMPVVWATQVLEQLAQTGLPSRAEITDAAMGERAECVMLNKGPHVVDAMRMLDDILRRMQSHQSKKRPLMRALRSWGMPGAVKAPE